MITETSDTTVKTVWVVAAGLGWLPLIILPAVVITLRSHFADWVFMWMLASAIFFGCKWLTWQQADRSSAGRFRSLAYLLAWPGMDAREFLAETPVGRPPASDWILAAGKTLFGAALLGLAAAGSMEAPLPAAWAGMIGTILLLHFGAFHLLALIYRTAGIAATPLMRSPSLSVSLAEFWGNRWNTGFNKLVHDFLFRPLARRTGAAWAAFLVFFISGLLHDLVISLPARGGYGLPTAYFALQGMAVLFERSRAGAALGLGRGLRGRLFMIAVTAAPAPLLFPPVFVRNIILPMLQAIGGHLGDTMNTILLLKLAALTHLGILAAGLLMPRVVGLWEHLRGLPDFIRKLFCVYYAFLGLCLAGFGAGTFVFAEELASGSAPARAVCGFLAIFWTTRLFVAAFVFDLRPYLTNTWRRVGLAMANTVFACLPILYTFVALKGGTS